MPFLEGIRLAFMQIRQDVLKSAFSLLGVIIGVLFLIIVVSVVEGVDRYVTEDLSSQVFGINTIQVRRIPQVQIQVSDAQRRDWGRRPRLTHDDAEAIRNGLTVPALVGVESGSSGQVSNADGVAIDNVQLRLVSPEILEIRDFVVEEGRAFSAQEAEMGTAVAILGTRVVETLFPAQSPIGQRIQIRDFPFRVVGVLEEQGSMLGQSLDNVIIVPALSRARTFLSQPQTVSGIVIQTIDPDEIQTALADAEGALRIERRLRPSEANNFALETADESLAFWDRISQVLFVALPALVGISLIVGGIVIMNIMLVSVVQRTREVGIRLALGARRSDIVTQFLIEATTVSGLGAIVGAVLGIVFTAIVRSTTPLPAAVAAHWVALGIVLGMGVGVVAGVYPAIRASQLDPVVALSRE